MPFVPIFSARGMVQADPYTEELFVQKKWWGPGKGPTQNLFYSWGK